MFKIQVAARRGGAHMWLLTPLRQKEADLCESEVNLFYVESARQSGIPRETLFQKNQNYQ